MANPQVQNDLIIPVNPYLYKYGMMLSRDATTPNSLLNISAGQCRDSNNIVDISLGALYAPADQLPAVAAPLIISNLVNGANGLDTGAVAASTMYAIYMIADSRAYKPVAGIITLASNSQPLMPLGYDSFRLIGYWATDGSKNWLAGYYAGTGSAMQFVYDAPQATAVTAGAATTYTGVALTTLVPPINNLPVQIYYDFSANSAANKIYLQCYNGTGDQFIATAPVVVGTAHLTGIATVLAQLNTAAPSIKYKVTNGSDAVALDVAGFNLYV